MKEERKRGGEEERRRRGGEERSRGEKGMTRQHKCWADVWIHVSIDVCPEVFDPVKKLCNHQHHINKLPASSVRPLRMRVFPCARIVLLRTAFTSPHLTQHLL